MPVAPAPSSCDNQNYLQTFPHIFWGGGGGAANSSPGENRWEGADVMPTCLRGSQSSERPKALLRATQLPVSGAGRKRVRLALKSCLRVTQECSLLCKCSFKYLRHSWPYTLPFVLKVLGLWTLLTENQEWASKRDKIVTAHRQSSEDTECNMPHAAGWASP